jgi:putative ABC transport system permease protein
LTIIGIIVGIGAVVGIISMSLGAQQQMEEQLGSLGADILTVSPGMQRAMGGGFGGGGGGPSRETSSSSSSSESENLTARDVLVLNSISNVEIAMGMVTGTADASYSSKSTTLSVTGVDPAVWQDITSETLTSGRFLKQGDMYSIVIGENIANSVFGKEIPINNKIIIEGKSFNIVGILSGGRSVYMPIVVARDLLDGVGPQEFDSISVRIEDVALANDTVNEITERLMLSRGILQEKSKDFTVTNPSAMQETMEETMSTLTLFLGAIAAISLLVGGIGIANTMFTSVLEKTKDIGIMKAIGAQNKDILMIFLLNSGLIGLVGGIGGVIAGVLASTAINTFAGITSTSSGMGGPGGGGLTSMLGGSSALSFPLIAGSILFAVLIGMIAGVIPAYRASKLNPVDALRYE